MPRSIPNLLQIPKAKNKRTTPPVACCRYPILSIFQNLQDWIRASFTSHIFSAKSDKALEKVGLQVVVERSEDLGWTSTWFCKLHSTLPNLPKRYQPHGWDKPVSYILLLRPVETCPIALTRKISTKHIKLTKPKDTWSISWLYITVLPSTKVIEEYLRMLACSSCTSNVHIWAYI